MPLHLFWLYMVGNSELGLSNLLPVHLFTPVTGLSWSGLSVSHWDFCRSWPSCGATSAWEDIPHEDPVQVHALWPLRTCWSHYYLSFTWHNQESFHATRELRAASGWQWGPTGQGETKSSFRRENLLWLFSYPQSHGEYRMSWAQHLEKHDVGERQNVPPAQNLLLSRPRWLLIWKLTTATSARWLFNHSNNVYFLLSQIHGINGMIDQYYVESLPHLLQELDDVYHDVSAVVLESLTEGSNKITEKVGRYRLTYSGTFWLLLFGRECQ